MLSKSILMPGAGAFKALKEFFKCAELTMATVDNAQAQPSILLTMAASGHVCTINAISRAGHDNACAEVAGALPLSISVVYASGARTSGNCIMHKRSI